MSNPAVRRTSRALVVIITDLATYVPAIDEHPPLPVGIGGLRLLELLATPDPAPFPDVLSQVVAEEGADEGELRELADAIAERGLLVDGPGDVAATPVAPARSGWPAVDGPRPDEHGRFQLVTPLVLQVRDGRFRASSWDGQHTVAVDAVELVAMTRFRQPSTWREALRAQREDGEHRVREARFLEIVTDLAGAGLLIPVGVDDGRDIGQGIGPGRWAEEIRAKVEVAASVRKHVARHDRDSRRHEKATGKRRVKVTPVAFNDVIPLALGQIFAYAKVHAGGLLDQEYDFRPDWVSENLDLDVLCEEPGVYLFSNYIWSTEKCRAVSEEVKRRSPHSVTIHGGPDTPKYRADCEQFFRDYPDVDVSVRGEGEITAAEVLERLVGKVGKGPVDLSVLEGVPGISYRDGDRVVHNPDRDRIEDLDVIPSPFLTGLYDGYAGQRLLRATVETNRGCPYSCTFCDWGSATASRIRKFDLERVFDEIEWCGRNGIMMVGPADSNFGMLERDVEIAEKIAATKAEHGFPRAFGVSYAKNTVRHLRRIISIMVDAEILTLGILSLQTMDPDTLDAVHRTNIKVSKYEELAREFSEARLPLIIEFMMGLPGATVDSFRNDLQQCIDREVQARIAPTELLVNSPMNEPAYREEHEIVTTRKPGRGLLAQVVSTSSYTREEYDQMVTLRRLFILCEDFGVLRHVARYVHHETGIREIDFLEGLHDRVVDQPERWPAATLMMRSGAHLMCPPVSWRALMDDVGDYVVSELGIAPDSALDAVLDAQVAVLPARDRLYPAQFALAHDVVAWHRAMAQQKDAGHLHDWSDSTPTLRSFGPGTIVVDDPERFATNQIGMPLEMAGFGTNWETRSGLERGSVLNDETMPAAMAKAEM